MNWTPAQIRAYNQLLGKMRGAKSWMERAQACFPDAEPAGAVAEPEINRIEQKLGQKLPPSLREIYRECGGILARHASPLVMPLGHLLERNRWLRGNASIADLYMPFDHLLFFGEEGNGDLYAFPIAADGRNHRADIFEWDHETDSRTWKASSIGDLLARLATDWSE